MEKDVENVTERRSGAYGIHPTGVSCLLLHDKAAEQELQSEEARRREQPPPRQVASVEDTWFHLDLSLPRTVMPYDGSRISNVHHDWQGYRPMEMNPRDDPTVPWAPLSPPAPPICDGDQPSLAHALAHCGPVGSSSTRVMRQRHNWYRR